MAVNHKSGRLVANVGSDLKRALHAALAEDGVSLKDWLVEQARAYVRERPHGRQREAVLPGSPSVDPEGRE